MSLLIVVLFCCLAVSTEAQVQKATPPPPTTRAPGRQVASNSSTGNTAPATIVHPVLDIFSLSNVDAVDSSVFFDFYFSAFYQDPNVPNMTAGYISGERVTQAQEKNFLRRVNLEFVNQREVSSSFSTFLVHSSMPVSLLRALTSSNAVTEQYPGYPWIELTTRYSGTFKVSLNLIDFPFDRQEVGVRLETQTWPNATVQFSPLIAQSGSWNFVASVSNALQWTVVGYSSGVVDNYYSAWEEHYSQAWWTVKIQRKSDYFVRKIVWGIVLLTLFSRMVYAMPHSETTRSFVITCSFVGCITYLFILTEDVPKVPYRTRLDTFVNGSILAIMLDKCYSNVVHFLMIPVDECIELDPDALGELPTDEEGEQAEEQQPQLHEEAEQRPQNPLIVQPAPPPPPPSDTSFLQKQVSLADEFELLAASADAAAVVSDSRPPRHAVVDDDNEDFSPPRDFNDGGDGQSSAQAGKKDKDLARSSSPGSGSENRQGNDNNDDVPQRDDDDEDDDENKVHDADLIPSQLKKMITRGRKRPWYWAADDAVIWVDFGVAVLITLLYAVIAPVILRAEGGSSI